MGNPCNSNKLVLLVMVTYPHVLDWIAVSRFVFRYLNHQWLSEIHCLICVLVDNIANLEVQCIISRKLQSKSVNFHLLTSSLSIESKRTSFLLQSSSSCVTVPRSSLDVHISNSVLERTEVATELEKSNVMSAKVMSSYFIQV